MGAIHKEDRITGRTLTEAFKYLQDSDREELGNDYYNGGWNNAQGIIEVSKAKFDSGEPSKHEAAWALCTRKPVENNMKTKTTVTNFPAKGARKWVTMYEATDRRYMNVYASEEKQTLAIKKARVIVEKNPDLVLDIHIVKKLINSSTKVADIKYKKSSTEKDGSWDIKGYLPF